MGNFVFIFFIFSSFFIVYLWSLGAKFSSIFIWNGSKFVVREDFSKNYNFFTASGEVYECGFSGVEEPLKRIEIQYLVLGVFFIIYEIEFLALLPFFLNVAGTPLFVLLLVVFSFLMILFSYWYEWDFYLLHFSV